MSVLAPRMEARLRALSSPYFAESDEIIVVPLQSGPRIFQGIVCPVPSVLLAVGHEKAVLLKVAMFYRKVRRKLWEGSRIRLGDRHELTRHRLVVEGEVQDAYASMGPTRKLLEDIARPVID
jgi:hypothetical protein